MGAQRNGFVKYINTETFSRELRSRAISSSERKVLIARLNGSDQEKDLTAPVNCRGFGRIRHFRVERHSDWPSNPLPNLPVAKALGCPVAKALKAQVFQNAACNWRCWYCYVDFDRLSANLRVSEYLRADELVDMYLAEDDRPEVIDLSGGQPDLVPEWVFWMMEALQSRGLAGKIFLWSDDNLSNWYFWKYLTPRQRTYVASFPSYSRVACFKGYDETSFAFNTLAAPELFEQQLRIFRRLVDEGLDMYAYVTFTSPPQREMPLLVRRFVDKLQEIHPNLPLRTVPLKIEAFTPTQTRMKSEHREAMQFQHEVVAAWKEELVARFPDAVRSIPICDVSLRGS